MSKDPENHLWEELEGSIYVVGTDFIKSDFSGQKRRIPVRHAIAFNVGEELAKHIVNVHNQTLELKTQASKGTGEISGKKIRLKYPFPPKFQHSEFNDGWIFSSNFFKGWGKTQDEAYVDWIKNCGGQPSKM